MKFTKLVAVMAAGLSLATLAACGSNSGKSGSSGKQVTLKVWGDSDNQSVLEDGFNKLNAEFEKENPNIKLDYQFSGTLDSINVAVQSNSLPDLFWTQGNKSDKLAQMAKNGYVLPITGQNYSRFSKDQIAYGTVNGKVYSSLPSFISYATVYYNKDIFKKYGLKTPKTFKQFTALITKLKSKNIIPVSLGGNGDFDRYWYVQMSAAASASKDINSIVADKKTATFDQLEETFANFQEFSKNGAFGSKFASTDGNGAKLAFTNQKAAMVVDGTWNSKSYFESGLNVGTFALPGKDGKTYAQDGPNNMNSYSIAKKTKHPKEAMKYITFLNSKKAEQILEDSTGEVPMMKDIKAKDAKVKQMANYDVVGANIYNKLSQVATEKSKPQDLFLTSLLPNLMTQKITAQEAIAQLKAELAK